MNDLRSHNILGPIPNVIKTWWYITVAFVLIIVVSFFYTLPLEDTISVKIVIKNSTDKEGGNTSRLPNTTTIYGKVLIPLKGSGEVKINQRVVVNIENFIEPNNLVLEGVLVELNKLTNNHEYYYSGLVEFKNEDHSFNFSRLDEYNGTAEIILKKSSLMKRIFSTK